MVTPSIAIVVGSTRPNRKGASVAEWVYPSYGVNGGIRAVEQLRLVLAPLRVATVGTATSLGLFSDFDSDGRPDPRHEATVHATLDQIVSWSRALAGERNAAATR